MLFGEVVALHNERPGPGFVAFEEQVVWTALYARTSLSLQVPQAGPYP